MSKFGETRGFGLVSGTLRSESGRRQGRGVVLCKGLRAKRLVPVASLGFFFGLSFAGMPSPALAHGEFGFLAAAVAQSASSSRDEVELAYNRALNLIMQDNDLAGAISEVDGAIESFDRDPGEPEPTVAALYLLRAVLLYSERGEDAKDSIGTALDRAVQLNMFADFPEPMRSERMTALLQEARDRAGGSPVRSMLHRTPATTCSEAVDFKVLAPIPEGGNLWLYWRKSGDSSYNDVLMESFFSSAEYRLSAEEHQNQDIEYYLVIASGDGDVVASQGAERSPLRLSLNCEVMGGGASVSDPGNQGERGAPMRGARKSPKNRKWRISPGVLVGLGAGWAHGVADRLYTRYFINPENPEQRYNMTSAACALVRRVAMRNNQTLGWPLTDDPKQLDEMFTQLVKDKALRRTLRQQYQQDVCSRRNPVKAGVAGSLLHIAPELGFDINERWGIVVFSRLQVVTGSKLWMPDDDPNSWDFVTPPKNGTKAVPTPLPWAVGLRGEYRVKLPKTPRLRLAVGLVGGYGRVALRVPMPFNNDGNGNSVTDDTEKGCAAGNVPVFPYLSGCKEGSSHAKLAEKVGLLAREQSEQQNTREVDTVSIGNIFAGATLRVEYLVMPWLGLGADLQLSAWFSQRTSVLGDFNLGPRFHF